MIFLSRIIWENRSIANINGITLASDINVNNVLTLSDGYLTVGTAILGIDGTISKTSGAVHENMEGTGLDCPFQKVLLRRWEEQLPWSPRKVLVQFSL